MRRSGGDTVGGGWEEGGVKSLSREQGLYLWAVLCMSVNERASDNEEMVWKIENGKLTLDRFYV